MVIFSGVWALANGVESCPCFWRVNRPAGSRPLLSRGAGQRGSKPQMGQTRGPSANLLKGALRDTYSVVVHAENERGDGINVALGEPLEHCGILTGFVEALVHVGQVRRINGLHADEDPLPS